VLAVERRVEGVVQEHPADVKEGRGKTEEQQAEG
jgi:hypothetical protein